MIPRKHPRLTGSVRLAFALVAAWSASAFAQAPPPGPPAVLILIIPGSAAIAMVEEDVPEGEGMTRPPGCAGSLTFAVESPLPDWGVAAELDGFGGPEGGLDPARVFVKPSDEAAPFVPFLDRVIVVTGHGPAPAIDLRITLALRPEWEGAPGSYAGSIRLIPFVPGPDGSDDSDLFPFLGPECAVGASGSIPELTWVDVSGGLFHVRADVGEGRFFVEPDLELVVATNASYWEVRLEGQGFVSGEVTIPLSRLLWTRLDPAGEPGPWNPLGENGLLLTGAEGRGVHPAAFRFAVEITMGDQAGDYSADLHLVGSGGL
jgi:hypothetical protein